MCSKLDSLDKTRMIDNLANSIKSLAVRPESIQSSEQAKKYDDSIRRMLDKINKLMEEV